MPNGENTTETAATWKSQLLYGIMLIVIGVILNVVGSKIPGLLSVPLYLDNIGTIFTSVIGGYLPGVIMGYISNIVNIGAGDPATAYYAVITVFNAVACTWLYKKGFFRKWSGLIVVILVLTAIGGGLGSILTWLLYGYGVGEGISSGFTRSLYETGRLPLFWAQFLSDVSIDLVDKTITVLISVGLLHLIPKDMWNRFRMDGWRQTPLTEKERLEADRSYSRGFSLRPKILTLIAIVTVFIAVVTTGISLFLYHQAVVTGELMEEVRFVARIVALFLGFFILILTVFLWLAEYNLIMPINTMALAAADFAANTEEERKDSVERVERIGIRTGDEIENLYSAFNSTIKDTVGYISHVQHQSETINRMQNGLILVLADMVESRDQCTGDHVRKTAAYTEVIMEQMKKNGDHVDELTDEFVSDVINSAPLHDVGKIRVSDLILNKPGKLTDEEFSEMKKHTLYGREVIEQAIRLVPDSEYLKEARNLAAYHHEKWNGQGYPEGLAGEDIPLSARIMAVADVFDALVSKRSYKEPFSFEKARSIIEESTGSHFDPVVAGAFLDAKEEVRRVYETHYAGSL